MDFTSEDHISELRTGDIQRMNENFTLRIKWTINIGYSSRHTALCLKSMGFDGPLAIPWGLGAVSNMQLYWIVV